jgi:hypothetical protein
MDDKEGDLRRGRFSFMLTRTRGSRVARVRMLFGEPLGFASADQRGRLACGAPAGRDREHQR